MQIATWNVNSIRTRLEQVRAWLEAEQPEVVCLQETKVPDELFPSGTFAALGYEAAISGQKAYNGVAILSRLPIDDVQVGFDALLPGDAEAAGLSGQRRVISARIEGLRVLNLYVPNGASVGSEKYAYKLAWLACLKRYLAVQEAEGDPLVMVGDFNIAPEDRDLHDPAALTGRIMASEPERPALRGVLGERLVDDFRMFEPAAGHWSWWDYRTAAWPRDRGWRIDHIYLDEPLVDCATGCVIHKGLRANEQPSDHAPVAVHLVWPPPEEEGEVELFGG
ncbi:MAG: exodeoxyribonuclease III [Synechococcaceae cyanobacterium]|nr:exodeoxyribonuclease III [Synechococcaceae cyanobacterium]